MSSRVIRILWIKVRTDPKNGGGLRLNFPISLNVLLELLDCFGDIAAVLGVFTRPGPASQRFTVRTLKELFAMLTELVASVADKEPYDLAEVSDGNVLVSIRVR